MTTAPRPLATHAFTRQGLDDALEFLKRTRWELRTLRKALIWSDRMQVIDVNRDCFEITGVGYADAEIVPLLNAVNAAFDPQTVHEPPPGEFKEYDTGRRYPWAYDRVM